MSDDTQKTQTDTRGMDNLTEVLRLQAETLARISERMAGLQSPAPRGGGLPPPMALPPRRDAGGEHGLPALAEDPSLSEESLPVLNAFRKFIEAERHKARVRLVWAALAFVVLLAAVLAAVLYLGRAKAEDLQSAIRATRQQAAEARASAEAEAKKMADTTALLKSDINRGLVAAHSNVVNQMGTRDAEIDKLRETISNLEMDNAELVGKLKAVIDRTEQLQAAYEAQVRQMQSFNDIMQATPSEVAPAATAVLSNRPPVSYTVISPAAPQVQFRLPSVP